MAAKHKKHSFSGKKAKAIELLALGDRTQVDIGAELGVTPQQVSKWKKDPLFMEAVVNRSRELLKQSLPEVYNSLSNHSKNGNDRHIKIFLDHLERLEQIKASVPQIVFKWGNPNE